MTTNPRLAALAKEFNDNKLGLDYLDELAGTEGRSLTPDEQTAYDTACTRMEQIEPEIKAISKRSASFDAVAGITAPILAETSTRIEHVEDRSPVTFDADRAGRAVRPSQSVNDIGTDLLARAKISIARHKGERATDAEETLQRVVAHGVAADGTAPVTIEGDLIKYVDANRYAVNASRRLPMPDNHAPTFKRPRASQLTTVGVQTTEGDILSSQRLQLTGDTVTKKTYGGVLSLSEQEIDWTDPALLGLAVQDLAQQYAVATDTAFTAALEVAFTASTQTVVSNTAASQDFIAALATAASVVYSNSKRMADTYFVSTGRWAYLAGLCDGNGRPLFPMVGPFNTAGKNDGGVASFSGFNILGLEVVVDPNLSTNVHGVAASSLCESYEQLKGLLSVNVPSTLEVQYAYRGYFAANIYTLGVEALETS